MNGRVFATDEMTSRGRLLAAYRGQPVDRLPFWAKVANSTWRSSQPDAIRKLDDFELLDYICADSRPCGQTKAKVESAGRAG